MKKMLFSLILIALLLIAGCSTLSESLSGSEGSSGSSGSSGSKSGGALTPVPAGHAGVYAVSHNGGGEDEKLMFPEDVTGLILERSGSSYLIYLANVYEGGEGEKIEELDYEYVDNRFSIPYGEVLATGEPIILDLAFCEEGLCGYMLVGDKKYELRLAKQE